MLLIVLDFIMRFLDISTNNNNNSHQNSNNNSNNNSYRNNHIMNVNNKMRQQQYCLHCGALNCRNSQCLWQHVTRKAAATTTTTSNSSSTSSGCDSNSTTTSAASSSKENYSITPQQLQQLRSMQQMQQQQLMLLQQQLTQRRHLQQQLRDQGVYVAKTQQQISEKTKALDTSSSLVSLTCNQQYIMQQRLQRQQQQQRCQFLHNRNLNNNKHVMNLNYMENDILCNNNHNNNNNNTNNNINNSNNNNNYNENNINNYVDINGNGFTKGQKLRRGMTEFSTNNDSTKTHFSQPLQNSPRHYNSSHNYSNLSFQNQTSNPLNQNYQKQALLLTNNAKISSSPLSNVKHTTPTSSTQSSANTSPLHYRNPFNSPNNSPFVISHVNPSQQHQQQQQQQLQLQQYLYRQKLSLLSQNQYQQHLYDILKQQQHLQKLLSAKDKECSRNNDGANDDDDVDDQNEKSQQNVKDATNADDGGNENDEISDESLKQNVAIVLNNLDRYNNALRSVILNEQINSNSSYLFDDNSLLNSNHNFLFSNIHCNNNSNKNNNNNNIINNNNNSKNNNNSSASSGNILNKKMATATAATPESDYNSNATTPGSRSNMLSYDSNMQHQQQQNNMVGFNITTAGPAVGGSTAISAGITSVNNIGCVGGGNGFASNNQYTNNGGIGNNGFCNNLASLSNNLNCSFASSHDFTHDNSDYQWFLDYGYRDGAGGMQRSVLSSLSASYNGFGDLVQYEDLAKNLDANLAEVDMESFRAEDIHSLLSQLPTYCKNLTGVGLTNGIGTGIIIGGHTSLEQSYNNFLQQEQLQNMLPVLGGGAHNMSTTSSNEPIDNSICKSELLFSPVKESHISVDSLDMDGYPDDGDIILTCQANKDNYTIAFEGSMLYSDESFCEPSDMALKNKQNFMKLHNIQDVNLRKALEASMSQSNRDYSPNMNQQNTFTINQLQRCPSGNNNTNINANTIVLQRPKTNGSVRKSSSLPNLHDDGEEATNSEDSQQVLNVSEAVSTSTMEHCKSRNLLPMCQMPISASASISEQLSSMTQYQEQNYHQGVQNHSHGVHHRHKHRCCCSHLQNSSHGAISNTNDLNSEHQHLQEQQDQQQHHHHGQSQKNSNISGSASSGNSNPAAFNLVKLFIKQKSSNCSSDDGQVISNHTCMDVSSGCWPSSEAVGSSSSSSLEQRLRKKSMHDSGKGSALSRHDEEDLCGDSKDDRKNFPKEHSTPKKALNTEQMSYDDDPSSSSTGSLTATNSPAHRKRSVPLRNPQLQNITLHNATGGSSTQSTDASHSNSEQLTQIYAASGAAIERRRSKRSTDNQRPISTASSSEMITRSMQTSCGSSSTRSSVSDRLRCVPPSFLSKLSELGDERKAPIYVIYPDYALPDLGFVKTGTAPDIIFSPFNYKMTIGSSPMATSGLKKRFSLNGNDDELLRTMDFKHIVDWDSLATLLPIDYRRRLKHIPQVNSILPKLEAELSHKPLFCVGPFLRKNRTNVCDCEKYLIQEQQNQNPNQTQIQVHEGSSSSGSSQQPSSGYRGSSTLLTDSELDNNSDPMKQMFVYQYEQQRMDSGVETGPGSVTKPTPKPRGILRKTISQATTRTKRNSMIEDQQTKATKLEKRRSLQEPPNNYGIGSAEELAEVFEEDAELYAIPKPRNERLSRKDLDARARARAESFLSSIPRSELKYYAEIASVLESSEHRVEYDAAALKKEVSRALSQQKKVSFNDEEQDLTPVQEQAPTALGSDKHKRFSTPPNSPNISLATNAVRSSSSSAALPRRLGTHIGSTIEEKEMRKVESNRFKRLQIQWELMSKDTNMLKDIVCAEATKSGGSTPTSANANKSRIPRPVSYPAGKVTGQDGKGSGRSPSRIVPPKRYSIAGSPSSAGYGKQSATSPATPTGQNCGGVFTPNRSRTPNSRVAITAPNTPKKRVQSPRTVPRVR